jgi:tetratricopeptide (TPR) repeat protein
MTNLKISTLLAVFITLLAFTACQENASKTTSDNDQITDFPVTTNSNDALAEFNKGLNYTDLGNGQKARAFYTKAIEIDPEFASAYLYRSWSSGSPEEFRKDISQAKAYMEKLSEGEKLFTLIMDTYLTNDWESRMDYCKELVNMHPDVPRVHLFIGNTYEENEQHAQAREHYQKAIDLNTEWVGGYGSMGNSYLFSTPKDLVKAEENYKKITELAPNESRAFIDLGDCYRAQNNLIKARDYYTKAVELDPQDPVAYSKKGHANSYLGNYEEARNDFRESRKYDEYKGTSLPYEAFTYLYEGDYKTALSWLEEQAGQLENMGIPESRMTSSKMSCVNTCSWIAFHHGEVDHIKNLVKMKKPLCDQVAQDVGTEEASLQQNANLLMWECLASTMEKDYTTANAKAEEHKTMLDQIKDPRKLEDYHFMIGYINLDQENYKDAIDHLLQTDPNDVYMKYLLAKAYDGSGEIGKATDIRNEIADYNFNYVGYALIRNEVKEKLASL